MWKLTIEHPVYASNLDGVSARTNGWVTPQGGGVMEWQYVVALIIVTPVIVLPATFIWYIIIRGTYQLLKRTYQEKHSLTEAVAGHAGHSYYPAGSGPCVSAAMGHVRKRTPYQPYRYCKEDRKEE
jgi:hypothetical protein